MDLVYGPAGPGREERGGQPWACWWEQYLGDVLSQGAVESAHGVGVELLGAPNQVDQVGHRVITHIGACLEGWMWPGQRGEPCPLPPSSQPSPCLTVVSTRRMVSMCHRLVGANLGDIKALQSW